MKIKITYEPIQHPGATTYNVVATAGIYSSVGATVDQAIGRLISDHARDLGVEMEYGTHPLAQQRPMAGA